MQETIYFVIIFIFFYYFLISIACKPNIIHKTHKKSEKSDLFEDVKYINNFNVKFANVLDDDYIYSPLGITFILSLIHLGTYKNTEKEFNYLFEYKYKINELNDIYNIFNNDNIKMTNTFFINDKYDISEKYINKIKHLILIKYFNNDNIQKVIKEVNIYIAKTQII